MPINNPRHSRFFWRSSAMFGLLDFERQFQEVNTAWEKTLGMSTGQLLAKKIFDFIHPDDQASTEYYFSQLDEGLFSVSFAARFRHYDGFYRNVLWEINSAASAEYAYYVVGMDITSREQPMVADEMITVLQDGVVLQYANGTIGACNPSAERILGITADQMMGWTLIDPDWRMIHEDGSPFPTETHPAICTLRTGQSYANEIIGIVKPDDSVIWLRLNTYPLWRDDVTTPYAVVISFTDMTQYKENEQALRKKASQPTNGSISENNYDLWDWDLKSNEMQFSPRWAKMLGFEENELIHSVESWHQRIHPNDYKRVMADIQNHLDGLTPVCENNHRLQHKDGNYHSILNRAVVVRDAAGKPYRMVGSHIDVTEPRNFEEELNEINKKYQSLMELESDAIFLIETETTKILEVNKAATQLYGYNRNQLLKMPKLELSAQPDKTEKSIKKGMKSVSTQYHKRENGTVFPVEVTSNPFLFHGKSVLTVIVRDMSERQRIETALWESESKYRQLFEAASHATIVFDANTQQIFDINRAAIDLYGYSKEEWLQMTTEQISAEPVKKRGAFGIGNKRMQIIPLRWHRKKDGTVFPVEISSGNTYLFQGRSLICATVRDITERKAHEEALRQERDFVKTLVQASPAFFLAINPDGKIRMINKAMLQATEYKFEDLIEKDFLTTFIPPAERSLVSNEIDNLIKTMQPSLAEYHILSQSGKALLVEWHSRAIVKAEGALDYFFGVGIDVTERKKTQGHLRLFKSIIESSDEAIAITNPDGQLVYMNPAHEKLFGRSFKEAKQMKYIENYPPSSIAVWEKEMKPALAQGSSWEGELDVLYKDGAQFPIWQRVDAVRDNKGNILFNFSLMHDISERQRMWETLRKQWEEHQMIFNTVPAMIWYCDANNQLLRQNNKAEEIAKNYRDELKTIINCQEVIQLGRAQYGITHNLNCAKSKDTSQTNTNDAHEENARWLQIDKIPYRDIQGNVVGVIVFAVDMTEHKQTQSTLQVNEERMHLVVENMPIMLNALDAEGNIIAWNRAGEEITGYSAEEIIGNSKAIEMLYPDTTDRRRMLSQVAQFTSTPFQTKRRTAQESEKNQANKNNKLEAKNPNLNLESEKGIQTWETKITTKNGKTKMIAWSSVSKQFPIPGWHTWFIGQDVTLRKLVERTYQDNEALVASVFNVTKLGVCLTDDRGRFLQVNRTYADFYGYRPEELIGQPFTTVLPAAVHNDAVREYYSLLMAREEPTLLKRRGEQHRNGQSFDVQIMASRVILEDKRRILLSIVSPWVETPEK
jgi:PAS domain S-box-containing protein